MSSTYTPFSHSVAGRVCAFFRQQPDEELTTLDIAQKFGVRTNSVSPLLLSCVGSGLLKRVRNARGEIVYLAGPRLLDEISRSPDTAPEPQDAPTAHETATAHEVEETAEQAGGQSPRQATRRGVLPPLDLSKLQIVTKAPPGPPHPTKWPELFAKLQAGQAVETVPISYLGSAQKAATAWSRKHGVQIVVRKLSAEHCGVYRIK